MNNSHNDRLTERRDGWTVVGRKHLIQRLRRDPRDQSWESVGIRRHERLGEEVIQIHRGLLLLKRRRRGHGREGRLRLLDEVGREGRVSVVDRVGGRSWEDVDGMGRDVRRMMGVVRRGTVEGWRRRSRRRT